MYNISLGSLNTNTKGVNLNRPYPNFRANTVHATTGLQADTFETNHKKKTGLWISLGLTAIAAIAVGFDYWKNGGRHCKDLVKKISNVFKSKKSKTEELKKFIEDEKGNLSRQFNNYGLETEISQRLEKISKLPLEEQKIELEKLYNTSIYFLELSRAKKANAINDFPEVVQQALKENKLFEACEKYRNYVDSLPDVYKASNVGKKFEETVRNVFGTKENINKHTYNLEKESKFAAVQRNCGGFKDTLVTQDGIARVLKNDEQRYIKNLLNSPGGNWKKVKNIEIGNGMFLQHGKSGNNKYVTELVLNDPLSHDTNGVPVTMRILISSPNGKMTPLQKDILKIAQNPEKLNLELISEITKLAPDARPELLIKEGVPQNADFRSAWKNLDYDLLLSAIQKMAG